MMSKRSKIWLSDPDTSSTAMNNEIGKSKEKNNLITSELVMQCD